MLTSAEIRKILELLGQETVVPQSDKFPYYITKRSRGYSDDPEIGRLQAKLSIMLEVAARNET